MLSRRLTKCCPCTGLGRTSCDNQRCCLESVTPRLEQVGVRRCRCNPFAGICVGEAANPGPISDDRFLAAAAAIGLGGDTGHIMDDFASLPSDCEVAQPGTSIVDGVDSDRIEGCATPDPYEQAESIHYDPCDVHQPRTGDLAGNIRLPPGLFSCRQVAPQQRARQPTTPQQSVQVMQTGAAPRRHASALADAVPMPHSGPAANGAAGVAALSGHGAAGMGHHSNGRLSAQPPLPNPIAESCAGIEGAREQHEMEFYLPGHGSPARAGAVDILLLAQQAAGAASSDLDEAMRVIAPHRWSAVYCSLIWAAAGSDDSHPLVEWLLHVAMHCTVEAPGGGERPAADVLREAWIALRAGVRSQGVQSQDGLCEWYRMMFGPSIRSGAHLRAEAQMILVDSGNGALLDAFLVSVTLTVPCSQTSPRVCQCSSRLLAHRLAQPRQGAGRQ